MRRWYLKNGYADVRIVSAVAEFDPRRNGFILTFTIEEGDRYTFGSVDIQSSVRDVDIPALRSKLRFSPGGVYNAELIEKSIEEMTIEVSKRGYAFARSARAATATSRPARSTSCSRSRRARAPISSASTSAATRARATMSSGASSISRKATPTIAC